MDPETLFNAFGAYVLWGGVALAVFAECGLFAVLAGDSLLFTGGLSVAGGGDHRSMPFASAVGGVLWACGDTIAGY